MRRGAPRASPKQRPCVWKGAAARTPLGTVWRRDAHLSRFACKCAVAGAPASLTCHGLPASVRLGERRRHSLVTVCLQVSGGGSSSVAHLSRFLCKCAVAGAWTGRTEASVPHSVRFGGFGTGRPPACALFVIAGGSGLGPTASVRPFREGWRFRAGDNHQLAPFL